MSVQGVWLFAVALKWRHNERDGVSNHRRLHCLLNCWFRRRSKKTATLGVTGLCAGNSPVPGEFPAQKASNAEYVFIWWRHHAIFFIWPVLIEAVVHVYIGCRTQANVRPCQCGKYFMKEPSHWSGDFLKRYPQKITRYEMKKVENYVEHQLPYNEIIEISA